MNKFKLAGICVLTSTLALSGCVARTYNLTRDRVDQDLSSLSGNRGYLMGQPPAPKERSVTRTTRIFEIELGPLKKSTVRYSSSGSLAANTDIEGPAMIRKQETQEDSVSLSSEKYTIGKNDTLQKISRKFYGTTKKWHKIYEANKGILRGPDKLYPGQVIDIPSAVELKTGPEKMEEAEENLK